MKFRECNEDRGGGNEAESGGAADSRYRITSNIFRANVRANALKKRGGGGEVAWSRKRRKEMEGE